MICHDEYAVMTIMAQQQEINLQKLAEPSRWSNEGADDPKEGVTWMSAQERLLLYILFLLMEQVLGSCPSPWGNAETTGQGFVEEPI